MFWYIFLLSYFGGDTYFVVIWIFEKKMVSWLTTTGHGVSDAGLPCGHFARCRLVELRVRRKGQEDHARLEEHLQLCSDPSFTTVSLVKKAWFFGNLKLMVFMIFGEMVQVSKSSQKKSWLLSFFSLYFHIFSSLRNWQMMSWQSVFCWSNIARQVTQGRFLGEKKWGFRMSTSCPDEIGDLMMQLIYHHQFFSMDTFSCLLLKPTFCCCFSKEKQTCFILFIPGSFIQRLRVF